MMSSMERLAGRLCEILFPIKEEYFLGNPKGTTAVCTLTSVRLLRKLANKANLEQIAVAGRLVTENYGIQQLVARVTSNSNITRLIVCGKDSRGHWSGQALLALWRSGVDANKRIIGAKGAKPFLHDLKPEHLKRFREEIEVADLRECTDVSHILALASSISQT